MVATQEALSVSVSALKETVAARAAGELIRFMKTVADKENTKLALIDF